MKTVYLVCEGKESSLDRLVLKSLLNDHYQFVHLVVESAGGDGSLGSVVDYIRQKQSGGNEVGKPHVLSIEDRNHRPRSLAENSWLPSSQKLIWTRHEIENFLIEPVVLSMTLCKLQEDSKNWPSDLPLEPTDVSSWLSEFAIKMRENQAGWYCYFNLMPYVLGYTFQIQRPHGYRGETPKATWIEYLCRESDARRVQSIKYGQDDRLTSAEIERHYDKMLSEISESVYWNRQEYLVDFGGKEFIDAIMREFHARNFRISRNDFEQRLIESLIECYRQELFHPGEFSKLAERFRQ